MRRFRPWRAGHGRSACPRRGRHRPRGATRTGRGGNRGSDVHHLAVGQGDRHTQHLPQPREADLTSVRGQLQRDPRTRHHRDGLQQRGAPFPARSYSSKSPSSTVRPSCTRCSSGRRSRRAVEIPPGPVAARAPAVRPVEGRSSPASRAARAASQTSCAIRTAALRLSALSVKTCNFQAGLLKTPCRDVSLVVGQAHDAHVLACFSWSRATAAAPPPGRLQGGAECAQRAGQRVVSMACRRCGHSRQPISGVTPGDGQRVGEVTDRIGRFSLARCK